jgi:hypothetical protein
LFVGWSITNVFATLLILEISPFETVIIGIVDASPVIPSIKILNGPVGPVGPVSPVSPRDPVNP